MRTKTILIIAFTALLTIFLMLNTDAVEFDLLFAKKDISKLVVVGIFTLIGFILGYWVAKPKVVHSSYDHNPGDEPENMGHNDHLSPEDRDYIS